MKHAKEHEPMCKQTRMLMMGDLLKHPIVDPDEPPPNDPSWEDVEVLDQAIKLLWVSIRCGDDKRGETTLVGWIHCWRGGGVLPTDQSMIGGNDGLWLA